MSEHDPIERLNDQLERRALDSRAAPDREIAELLGVARRLRDMPREAFRAQLKTQLREEAMASIATTAAIQLREGFHSITPYIVVPGAARFIEFVKEAFGAEEKVRYPSPDGSSIMHAEVKIGDSMIELSDGNEQHSPRAAAIHLYLPDTDSAYRRAIAAGGTSLHP